MVPQTKIRKCNTSEKSNFNCYIEAYELKKNWDQKVEGSTNESSTLLSITKVDHQQNTYVTKRLNIITRIKKVEILMHS